MQWLVIQHMLLCLANLTWRGACKKSLYPSWNEAEMGVKERKLIGRWKQAILQCDFVWATNLKTLVRMFICVLRERDTDEQQVKATSIRSCSGSGSILW